MKLELKLSNKWLEATWYTEENEAKTQVHCEYFSGHPEHIAMLRAKALAYDTELDEAIVSELIAGYVPPTQTELDAMALEQATAQAKADKELALKTLTVTTASGKTFDGDETARGDMLTAITVAGMVGQTDTNWKMADNTIQLVTLAEMQEALMLAIQKKGVILGAVGA